MKIVNSAAPKKDGMKLATGAPVYTNDLAPKESLIIKLLRSEHHFARIKHIDTSKAEKVPGVACVLTYKDVPNKRFTRAGQTYPEPSPQDWKMLDEIVRYKGDEVAIVAATTEAIAIKAMKLIKVEYEVLEPVLDYKTATEHVSIVHPETDAFTHFEFGFKPEKNIASSYFVEVGDYEKGFEESDVILTRNYETQATHPAMMEPVTTYTYLDHTGRLVVVSSTQIPFHVRRMIANAMDLPMSQVRVIKPRIGGGFGCKQSSASEFFPALVTLKTGKPAKIFYTRKEIFLGTTRRHPFYFEVKIGATKDGIVKAFDVKATSDTGAYGEHAGTVMSACAEKIMAYYKTEGYRFDGKAVYTNHVSSGAYRGYGKTQGGFAIESIMNELAHELNMDPTELREKNIIHLGDHLRLGTSHVYDEDVTRQDTCELEYCLKRGREMIDWYNKYPSVKVSDTKVRGVGMALAIQGSGVLNIDSGSATIKLNSDGFFTLLISATDMGTGCDTILSQMAAESLQVPLDRINVYSADTDVTPYDDGSYASSSTYVTGTAVRKASDKMIETLKSEVAAILSVPCDQVTYSNGVFRTEESTLTLEALGGKLNRKQITVTDSHVCDKEAPPYKAGFVEVEIDLETGQIHVVDFVGVIDCGTPINTNLATVQAQGGMLQGIGMALYEESERATNGDEKNASFLTYKLPSRKDALITRVEFAPSYEPTGPYGAKSIGEIVINTASPAIMDAIFNATGIRVRKLPITPSKFYELLEQNRA
ncbi:xanthine dehydrogenase family protein molybdopterin-binding subunit [Fusibacter ferrireducens]|uniref:Molybdopterin-dependent oxidoreductase n=1 Tax=Fusibacter ferrireducens TaxID=2785058 RepID=A0ABR9ZQB1_9FIRM|nr:molybdopterin cofactor-binding domain-containing protein [Fusibacter ferrireducens]MBF4692637.1 molybdopterin-dependent oxidoreductase [Fusibacter ferrireducens]